jgi:tetratricopeptide (TPR) repeat protein
MSWQDARPMRLTWPSPRPGSTERIADMKLFCPSCDAIVDVASAADHRCPQCHRTLDTSPQASQPGATPAPGQSSSRTVLVIAASLLVAAVGGGLWLKAKTAESNQKSQPASPVPAVDPASWKNLGLTGDRAVPPGTPDAALTAAAKGAKDVESLLKASMGAGKLELIAPTIRRRAPIENTATLWSQVVAGKAQPVHALEVALLAKAMLEARGEPAELVTDAAGVQTPLLLSRTRIGVRSAGKILEPFAKTAMQKPTPLPVTLAHVWWLVLRAHGARVRGDFTQVNEDLKAADTLMPGNAATLFARGVAELDQGLVDLGVPKCEQALAKQDDPLARLFLAEVAVALEQPVKALQRVEEALKSNPDLPEALVTKAILAAQRIQTVPEAQKAAQKAEARALFDKALQADPKVAGARAGLAQLLLLDKDEAGAEKVLREALVQGKDLEAALSLAELLRSQKKPEESIKVLESLGIAPDDDRYVTALVTAYMVNKQPEKGIALIEEAHKLNPSNRQIALMRADLLRQAGRVAEAIAALEPLKKGPDGMRMILLQSQLYLQEHQADKAIAQLEPLVAKAPDERDPQGLLLMAYEVAGQKEKAQAIGKKLMEKKLLKPAELANVYLQVGDSDAATSTLEEAVKTSADVDGVTALAMLYTASGRKADAVALRDRMAKSPGELGPTLKAAIDKAITAAEAEMERMKQGGTPGGEPPAIP